MKIIKTIVLSVLFIAGVFLASANVQSVSLVFLPDLPIAGWPEYRSTSVPLFILVLGALTLGVLLGGAGAMFEQVRLRTGLRRARKENERMGGELAEAKQRAQEAEDELERTRREQVEREAREARAAEEAEDAQDAQDTQGAADAEGHDDEEGESAAIEPSSRRGFGDV